MDEYPQTPVTPDGGQENSFPVDLSREEYIAFTLLLAKQGGALRFRRGQLAIFCVLLVVSLLMLAVEYAVAGTIDLVMVLVVLFIAVAGGFLLFGLPAYMKRNAGRAYDQSVLGGHEYYGMLVVYGDRLEKVSGGEVSAVRFADNAAYMETEDMMVLMASSSRAIVLPARCLTAKDAELVRRTVLPAIPPMRQRLIGKLIPKAAHRLPPPKEKGEREPALLEFSVSYTPEEFVKMVGDSALRAYLKMLPVYSGVSVVSGILFGLVSGIPAGLAAFVIVMLAMFLLNTLAPKSRARRQALQMSAEALTVRIAFTERGLVASTPRQGAETRIPWVSLQHAVEKEDSVEFYNSHMFIRVPKRCVPDMEELRRVVDGHRQ